MTELTQQQAISRYAAQIGDNGLIIGHRMSEWCFKAPTIEMEMALMNCALDLIGQARELYTYAGVAGGEGKKEDDFAYLRDEQDFRNNLLAEVPNGDWGDTIVRLFFMSAFNNLFYKALSQSKDTQLAAIGEKSLKEVIYHLRFSSEWLIRLGDGTEESHARAQKSIDSLWMYVGELFTMSDVEKQLLADGISVDVEALREEWEHTVNRVLRQATLHRPQDDWAMLGGKAEGRHTEHFGYIITDMQYMQRRYPGCEW
ncbi:1,2-phenylacetyl-CoA epoxidase subunit PaaC [Paremcibacter congregatus]|uniref:Phenylacetate-CoA oxygenase subunit PaaI n=1 Tax=Paremcibacter congregatus TaxID=2043170 RepID=A0A2G4YWE0_9PROT|nr:1,2-phenylacetyl-CoA epoxidase subunit PaaC [Paremcibacter congregatus]PHZ86662.1 phenylacetate-CoA oxygenase subunit PaaI [Paremcibacter congregatus]QDE26463.1 phenylacetate-CoA oxygenase subunit PaaC [Paremcibacter congregatus]